MRLSEPVHDLLPHCTNATDQGRQGKLPLYNGGKERGNTIASETCMQHNVRSSTEQSLGSFGGHLVEKSLEVTKNDQSSCYQTKRSSAEFKDFFYCSY